MKRFGILLAVLVIALAVTACGSDSDDNPADGVASSSSTNEFGFETSIIAKPDSSFTFDDVKATGWKSSKELPADLLEGVSAVWFGFFQQKNLEVWIYESHAAAKEHGTGPAEEIVSATRGVSAGGAGPYMKQTTQFRAYGVVGNLLVLCETEVTVCEDFANALP